jgi:hypothetical protein
VPYHYGGPQVIQSQGRTSDVHFTRSINSYILPEMLGHFVTETSPLELRWTIETTGSVHKLKRTVRDSLGTIVSLISPDVVETNHSTLRASVLIGRSCSGVVGPERPGGDVPLIPRGGEQEIRHPSDLSSGFVDDGPTDWIP